MRAFDTALPIDAVLGDLAASLRARSNAVLVAPPGAGKTTRVPLALLDEPWTKGGKLILLEPRRLAARGAANRMAQTLGEQVGETVGLRVRLGSKIGPNAYVWGPDGRRILEEGGPYFTAATAINDAGQIAGVFEREDEAEAPAEAAPKPEKAP